MNETYMIIYENSYGECFKSMYDKFATQKEVLNYFKEHNTKYGYKVIAIRKVTLDNIYL